MSLANPDSYPLYCIAHRGGSQSHTENTLAALAESLALGVDAIEIDIWNVAGELLVTHDRRLGITLPGQGRLLDQPLANLKKLVLSCGSKIATLAEVLSLCAGKVVLNIEIKGPDCALPLAGLLQEFSQAQQISLEQFVVSSFDHQQLYQLMRVLPAVKRGVLIEGLPLDYAAVAEPLQAYSFHPGLTFVNRELVQDARRRGLKVMVYTVNHEDDWQLMCDYGADGVFTDFPAQLLAWNRALAKGTD